MNALPPPILLTTGSPISLRILATTDLHMNLTGHEYFRNTTDPEAGLDRLGAMIEAARADCENCLLFDNGDILQGSPMADLVAARHDGARARPHPAIAAMNNLGYDAAAPGNHDFNYGADFLQHVVGEARFPVVAANVWRRSRGDPDQLNPFLQPHTILERELSDHSGIRQHVRIGVIGFVPPQVTLWDRHRLDGHIITRDIIEVAKTEVAHLKSDGADIVIALCHSGIGPAQHALGMENAAVPLAAVDGIDALVLGHSHRVFPSPEFSDHADTDTLRGTIHGKPAVMSGVRGSHLGVIELVLTRQGNRWAVTRGAAVALAANMLARSRQGHASPGSGLRRILAADHRATLAHIRRKVGKTAVPLNTHFAQVAPNRALAMVAAAQRSFVARAVEGTDLATLPLLSAASPIKAGGPGGPNNYTDIPAGALTIRDVADLYCFPNRIAAVRINGRDLRAWLERAAGMFCQLTPARTDQMLLDPRFPAYNFDVIHGLKYQMDLGRPSLYDPKGQPKAAAQNGRVRALTWQGKPVHDDQEFLVATNDFRAFGGGNFPGTGPAAVAFQAPVSIHDVLIDHLRNPSTTPRAPLATWSFRPMNGLQAIFETSPAARRSPGGDTPPNLCPQGISANGFAQHRLTI